MTKRVVIFQAFDECRPKTFALFQDDDEFLSFVIFHNITENCTVSFW